MSFLSVVWSDVYPNLILYISSLTVLGFCFPFLDLIFLLLTEMNFINLFFYKFIRFVWRSRFTSSPNHQFTSVGSGIRFQDTEHGPILGWWRLMIFPLLIQWSGGKKSKRRHFTFNIFILGTTTTVQVYGVVQVDKYNTARDYTLHESWRTEHHSCVINN